MMNDEQPNDGQPLARGSAGRVKRVLLRMLFPAIPASVLIAAVSAVLLAVVFVLGMKHMPIAYASYVLSAYALVSWIARAVRAFPLDRILDRFRRNAHVARVIDDKLHRLGLTTAASSALEFVWVATNAFSAVRTGSFWFTTLAAYYAALAVMRLMLAPFILQGANAAPDAKPHGRELRFCRLCGVVLALCAVVFAGMSVLVLTHEGSFSYSEYMVYLVALYAFYSAIGGTVRFVRERRSARPAVFTANAASVVTGAVSMLSLAAAMIDLFGEGDEAFRTTMIGSIGGAVCALALVLGLLVVRRSSGRVVEHSISPSGSRPAEELQEPRR